MSKFKLKEKAKAAEKAIQEMIRISGQDYLLHFQNSFRKEGFTDESLVKWKARKDPGKANKKGKYRRILVKSGRLKRSLTLKYGLSGLRATVYVSGNIPYAQIHNEGGTIHQVIRSGARRYTKGDFKHKTEASVSYDRKTGGRRSKYMTVRGSGVQFYKAHERTIVIPKRQYLGNSRNLDRRILAKYKAKINTAIANA